MKLMDKVQKAMKILKGLKTFDLPDGSTVKLDASPTIKDGVLEKLNVDIELDKELSDDVEFHAFVKGNVMKAIEWNEDEDFQVGFSFTKRF